MKQPEVKANYHMGRTEMLQNGRDLIACARRDATEFKKMGIEDPFVDQLETDIQTMDDAPDDVEELEDKAEITANKDALADQVRDGIRSIMQRAENAYGLNSARYRRFGTKGLSDLKDGDLYHCAKRVVRVSRANVADLGGLTTAAIDDFEQLNKTFEDKIDAQHNAISDRDIATEDRQKEANSIYDREVKIANTGKTIWFNKSEAKYNDYVIYDSPAQDNTAPPAP